MFLTEKNFKLSYRRAFLESTEISASEDLNHRRAFLKSTEISASEDLNALEKVPPQIMPLWILSGKGAVQIMPFRKLGGKFHFFLRFCTRKRSKTYINLQFSLLFYLQRMVNMQFYIICRNMITFEGFKLHWSRSFLME